jgi:hypothetical protein
LALVAFSASSVRVPEVSRTCGIYSSPCECSLYKGCGWSSSNNACVEGAATDCQECSAQAGCISAAIPSAELASAIQSQCADFTSPCECSLYNGCGWSTGSGACETDKTTDCIECSAQSSCSKTDAPSAITASAPQSQCSSIASACDCALISACGWSTTSGACEDGKDTSCNECSEQPGCNSGTPLVQQPSSFPPALVSRGMLVPSGECDDKCSKTLGAVNEERANVGLGSVCLNSKLMQAARVQAAHQSRIQTMSHDGPGEATCSPNFPSPPPPHTPSSFPLPPSITYPLLTFPFPRWQQYRGPRYQ